MISSSLFFLIITFSFISTQAQKMISLYPGPIPNSRQTIDEENVRFESDSIQIVSKVSRPGLTIFLPAADSATGEAVIICPGGGYVNLAVGYEGEDVARRFVESGIAAFVLKYRIPNDSTMIDKEYGPLQDAQQAILIVRTRAKEWRINEHRIGIMGFSAGGHLASTAGTHFAKNYIENPDHISLRPDFMILIYPVISFDSAIAHQGSEHNLLGPNPSGKQIAEFSNEKQVTKQTPPAFLVHARDDDAVPYANSLVFADALKKHHIPVEVYLFDKGGHGFGMNNKTSQKDWMKNCIRWIKALYPTN